MPTSNTPPLSPASAGAGNHGPLRHPITSQGSVDIPPESAVTPTAAELTRELQRLRAENASLRSRLQRAYTSRAKIHGQLLAATLELKKLRVEG